MLLLALSQTTALLAFYAIWCGLGVAMAATLYEPAFAVMVAAYPGAYRRRIGILTLTGGLASTAFWPLTHVLVTQYGWRGALLMLGAIHLFLCAPLHSLALPRSVAGGHANHAPTAERTAAPGFRPGPAPFQRNASFWLMAFCFMAFGFVTAAMALHVIPLLESRGATPAAAIALAALIGPMQSSGRITEVLFGARVPALALGAFTVLLIPAALVALLFGGATTLWFYIFVIVYGAGLGLITIVRATTPVEIFGRDRYASTSGALGGPAIMARCVGPFAATALLTASQDYDSVLTLMLAVAAAGVQT